MRIGFYGVLLISAAGLFCGCGRETANIEQAPVFVSGRDGYDTFRIPALLATPSGAVLAICEGRKRDRSDSGDIDLVVRRSVDNGRTWSGLQVIWDDGDNTCGNPCAVVDRATGVIWLLMTHNLGTDREPEIIAQTSTASRTVWVCSSADDGLTWTAPREITAAVKQSDWTWYATGPGNGIQLRSGRLLVPCDHIEAGTDHYYSHVIFSDDHGASWQLGGRTPQHQVNECAVVERADGTLLLNMRNYDRRRSVRMVSTSADEGLTWSDLRPDSALIEPICQASLIAVEPGEGGQLLLFSNPADREERVRLTVKLSADGGATWSAGLRLTAGPAAYSSLAQMADGRIGCLYETGNESPYEQIRLARFALAELLDEE